MKVTKDHHQNLLVYTSHTTHKCSFFIKHQHHYQFILYIWISISRFLWWLCSSVQLHSSYYKITIKLLVAFIRTKFWMNQWLKNHIDINFKMDLKFQTMWNMKNKTDIAGTINSHKEISKRGQFRLFIFFMFCK